jgi:hypothetical protein
MIPGMVEDAIPDGPGDGQWLTVAVAARRLGKATTKLTAMLKL